MPAMSGGMPLVRSTGQLLKYGRKLLENFLNINRGQPTNPNDGEVFINAVGKNRGRATKVGHKRELDVNHKPNNHQGKQNVGSGSEGQGWSLASYLARTTTRTLAAELRRKAALQFSSRTPVVRRAYCRGTPLYAFVGLGFAANQLNNLQPEEDGFKNVCSQIKELFNGSAEGLNKNNWTSFDNVEVGHRLDDYILGPMIAKGCNSAVYSARLKDSRTQNEVGDWNSKEKNTVPSLNFDTESTIANDQERSVSESLTSQTDESDITILSRESDIVMTSNDSKCDIRGSCMSGEDFIVIDDGMETDDDIDDDVFNDEDEAMESDVEEDVDALSEYPLAIKMMFNYDAESNAADILRNMENEAVPARMDTIHEQLNIWANGNRVRKKRLKPHANVVDMFGVFVDDVPTMPDAFTEYPDALPTRLNPNGCGRNKTLFIVMKRYRTTLREFLAANLPTVRQSTLIFCQLLESILHVNRHGIAHRDLKSDNILLDGDMDCPHLVVTDFGCCLAEGGYGLRVPYNTHDTCKGGNGSLMAPEIATAEPGRRRYLDYGKSDLWAAGTLMYEIFGGENPFYNGLTRKRLDSRTYRSRDIPELPAHVPRYIQRMGRSLLRWKPSRRPDVLTVTNALHLLLWCPTEWLFSLETRGKAPTRLEVVRWLLTFAAGVMCRRASQDSWAYNVRKVECALQCQFLARLDLDNVMEALHYLWSVK